MSFFLLSCSTDIYETQKQIGDESLTNTAKSGTGEIRQDTEPLTNRFPQLSGLVSAHWMSGTLGRDRIPGPSTYWIDAVVKLNHADFQTLLNSNEALSSVELSELGPELSPELRKLLPVGALLGSAELDSQFSQPGYSTRAFLIDDSDSLLLLSVFS